MKAHQAVQWFCPEEGLPEGPLAEVFNLIFQLRVSSRHNALKDASRFPDEQAWQLCHDETLGEI